jgi:hypothetical protein
MEAAARFAEDTFQTATISARAVTRSAKDMPYMDKKTMPRPALKLRPGHYYTYLILVIQTLAKHDIRNIRPHSVDRVAVFGSFGIRAIREENKHRLLRHTRHDYTPRKAGLPENMLRVLIPREPRPVQLPTESGMFPNARNLICINCLDHCLGKITLTVLHAPAG